MLSSQETATFAAGWPRAAERSKRREFKTRGQARAPARKRRGLEARS